MSYAVPGGRANSRLLSEESYVPADPQSPDKPLFTGSSQLLVARFHYYLPVSRQRQSIAERFRELLILAERMQRRPSRKARENQAVTRIAALRYLRNPQ